MADKLSVWKADLLEEALKYSGLLGPTHWARVRRTVRAHVDMGPFVRGPETSDILLAVTLIARSMSGSRQRVRTLVRDAYPDREALMTDLATDEQLAALILALLISGERVSQDDLYDAAPHEDWDWMDPTGGWWVSNGDGMWARAESHIAATTEELAGHYFRDGGEQ